MNSLLLKRSSSSHPRASAILLPPPGTLSLSPPRLSPLPSGWGSSHFFQEVPLTPVRSEHQADISYPSSHFTLSAQTRLSALPRAMVTAQGAAASTEPGAGQGFTDTGWNHLSELNGKRRGPGESPGLTRLKPHEGRSAALTSLAWTRPCLGPSSSKPRAGKFEPQARREICQPRSRLRR